MKEKKYIDRIFQEKFKDFEASPRKDVWKSISAKLQEKEQKKPLLPLLWTRIAGVAAIIALAFLIDNLISPTPTIEVVTNQEEAKRSPRSIIPSGEKTTISIASEKGLSPEEDENSFPGKTKEPIPSTPEEDNPTLVLVSTLEPKKLFFGSKRASISIVFLQKENSLLDQTKESLLKESLSSSDEEKMNLPISSEVGNIEISTHAAPIYYGNFGDGSFIDPMFKDNNSQSEITYSYGINISYAISENLKIRSGINKVLMSHNTYDVVYRMSIEPMAIENINYLDKDLHLQIIEDPKSGKNTPQFQSSVKRRTTGNSNKGLLNQTFGYIEVPVELEYNILDKRMEINIIGGASTLFLDENMISIQSENFSSQLGNANNLNDMSFSTNIGIGFDYNLSQKFILKLEPMFKYQLNTFDAASNGLQPYYLGIYSGFSFEF